MKEGFINNSLNKIKKGAVVGSLVVASVFSSTEKVSAEDNFSSSQKDNTETIKTNIESIKTDVVNFKDFNPAPGKKSIHIKDEKLKAYIIDNYSIQEIKYPSKVINESNSIKVDNPKEFKKEILEVAQGIGYSEENIKNLSIHDAILLSGNILSKKISYNYDMLDSNLDSIAISPEEKVLRAFRDGLSGIDSRNEEGKRVDNLACDKIFSEGKGICRNYAAVNKAVFEVIKSMNNNLKNVYMKWYSPSSLGESIALPHAWNQIINISGDNNNIKLEITYVDPTWLDTRKPTADGTGDKININDDEIYNAFDSHHFFAGCLSAHIEIAELYELLGSNEATFKDFISNDKKEINNSYFELAYNQRIKICKIALDSAKNLTSESINKSKTLFFKFKISLMEAIANANEDKVGISSFLGPMLYDIGYLSEHFTEEKLIEIKDILSQGEKVFGLSPDQNINMRFLDGENMKEEKLLFFSLGKKLDEIFDRENKRK